MPLTDMNINISYVCVCIICRFFNKHMRHVLEITRNNLRHVIQPNWLFEKVWKIPITRFTTSKYLTHYFGLIIVELIPHCLNTWINSTNNYNEIFLMACFSNILSREIYLCNNNIRFLVVSEDQRKQNLLIKINVVVCSVKGAHEKGLVATYVRVSLLGCIHEFIF